MTNKREAYRAYACAVLTALISKTTFVTKDKDGLLNAAIVTEEELLKIVHSMASSSANYARMMLAIEDEIFNEKPKSK